MNTEETKPSEGEPTMPVESDVAIADIHPADSSETRAAPEPARRPELDGWVDDEPGSTEDVLGAAEPVPNGSGRPSELRPDYQTVPPENQNSSSTTTTPAAGDQELAP